MQTIVYHSKARKTMCGMGTFCLIGMISFQLTMQNGDRYPTKATDIKAFVDTCRLGLTCFLTGEGVTPIAGMASEYTIGLVLKRGEDSAAVMIFAYSVREVYCLFKNGTWDTAITKL